MSGNNNEPTFGPPEDVTINDITLNDTQDVLDAREYNYIYIKGNKAITRAQKQELAQLQVTIQEYIGEHMYLCQYLPHDLSPIRSLPYISRVNFIDPRFKITNPLKNLLLQHEDIPRGGPADEQTNHDVIVLLHEGADSQQVVAEILQRTGGHLPSTNIVNEGFMIRIVSGTGQAIEKISEIDAVKSIEPVIPDEVENNFARVDLQGANFVINDTLFEGEGQIVAIADTGFDLGNLDNIHPAFTNRIVALIPVGRPGLANDVRGHGTHVTGSVCADGNAPNNGGVIRGTAPRAKVVLQSLTNNTGGLTVPALENLFSVPYTRHGARIATNSYGPRWSPRHGQLPYNTQATSLDKFVWSHWDHLVLFSAGNDGRQVSATGAQIGAYKAAKNNVVVGSTYSSRPPPPNHEHMAPSSSRGPTKERRIKPDVVSPGRQILSAASRAIGASAGLPNDPLWRFSSGTSMATPLVAGCAAALRSALIASGSQRPSAALVKALLINGADTLTAPIREQGWGRVNLRNSLRPSGVTHEYVENGTGEGTGLQEDEDWQTPLNIAPNSRRLKVTLVWNDRPGALMQNYLILSVRGANGQVCEGSEGQVVENNVQQVVWDQPPVGPAVLSVTAVRIARMDDRQPFAIVWRVQ